jgi:hypothetical protein
MKKTLTLAIAALTLLTSAQHSFGQCADAANITSFTYNGTTYEVIQENQTWANAAACAVERGGHLIEIDDASEQAMIFGNLPAITSTSWLAITVLLKYIFSVCYFIRPLRVNGVKIQFFLQFKIDSFFISLSLYFLLILFVPFLLRFLYSSCLIQ